jgi:hypothetical protein
MKFDCTRVPLPVTKGISFFRNITQKATSKIVDYVQGQGVDLV